MWGLPLSALHGERLNDSEMCADVQLVRDALAYLLRLLDASPRLYQAFLNDSRCAARGAGGRSSAGTWGVWGGVCRSLVGV